MCLLLNVLFDARTQGDTVFVVYMLLCTLGGIYWPNPAVKGITIAAPGSAGSVADRT